MVNYMQFVGGVYVFAWYRFIYARHKGGSV